MPLSTLIQPSLVHEHSSIRVRLNSVISAMNVCTGMHTLIRSVLLLPFTEGIISSLVNDLVLFVEDNFKSSCGHVGSLIFRDEGLLLWLQRIVNFGADDITSIIVLFYICGYLIFLITVLPTRNPH